MFNLLANVQDNYQTEPIEPVFAGKAISDSQLWIIGIIAFAIIITILATIIIYCLYSKNENNKKLYKYIIVIAGIIIAITFIILGVTACKAIR